MFVRWSRAWALIFLVVFCCILAGCAASPLPATVVSAPIHISPDGVDAAEPAVAAAPDGGSYVAYVEHHGDAGADVYFQKLDEKGGAIGPRVRVSETSDIAKAWRGDPPTIAVSSDGCIYIGWTRKYTDANAKGNDLILSVSQNGGASFSTGVKVNDDTLPASHGMHSLATTVDGRIVMAWLDERNVKAAPHDMSKMSSTMHHDDAEPNSEVFSAVSTDGGKTFSPNQKLASEACPCCKTTLLAAADGTVYAAWRQVLEGDHRHIAVASSRDGGATFSKETMVSNDQWQIHACPVSGAALSSSEKGEVEVAWYTEGTAGPSGLYFAHSHDGGKTFSERKLISDAAKAGTPTLVQTTDGLTAIFAGKDGNVQVVRLFEHAETKGISSLSNAAVASAAVTKNGPIFVFSRMENDVSSIWFSRS
jgi:hypothetical protein